MSAASISIMRIINPKHLRTLTPSNFGRYIRQAPSYIEVIAELLKRLLRQTADQTDDRIDLESIIPQA